MLIQPCPAPTDSLEPAPLTDLSIHMGVSADELTAFWAGDEAYVVRARVAGSDDQWYSVEAETTAENPLTEAERVALGQQMASILPMSTGRVAFPVGSNGRTVYRIWRSIGANNQSRTKIRAVRAARSRRLPA
ncbi:MAG: hypothetical protein ACO1Q7_14045 [Gemmatimonas sp.]